MAPSISLTSLNVIFAGFGAAMAIPLFCSGRPARRLLGVMLALWGIAAACISLDHANVFGHERWLERLEFTIGFAVGPILLWYVRAVMHGRRPDRPALAHFVPAAVCVSYGLVTGAGFGRWDVPVELVLAHQMSYTGWSLVVARRPLVCGSPIDADYSWCRLTLLALLVVHGAQLVRLTWPHVPELREVVPVALNASVLMFSFAGFATATRRPSSTEPTFGLSASKPEDVPPPKYRKSMLSFETASTLRGRLESAMESGVYREPDLTLARLGQKLGATSHQLSQVLNQHLKTTFADYVNGLRIEDAKRRLLDPSEDVYTIDAIAESSGFSSRSAFYAAFRRAEGVTPSEFRKTHRN